MTQLEQFKEELKAICGNTQVVHLTKGGKTYSKICTITNELYQVTIKISQWECIALHNLKVQDVCPKLTAEQREFIISGTTPAEWNDMFKDVKKEQERSDIITCPVYEHYKSILEPKGSKYHK